MRLYGKLVIVPNKSDGRLTALRRVSLMPSNVRGHNPLPLPLLGCLLMFAVHVNACTSALILHCNVTLPIFSRFVRLSGSFAPTRILPLRLFHRYARGFITRRLYDSSICEYDEIKDIFKRSKERWNVLFSFNGKNYRRKKLHNATKYTG